MKKNTKGFTLIELLVVIAIIAILAAVVLAALNSARTKGKATSVKQDLVDARAQASLYYNDNNLSYAGVCANDVGLTKGLKSFKDGIATIVGGTDGVDYYCNSSSADWVMAAKLPTGGYWCVDSRGSSRGQTITTNTAYTSVKGNAAPAAADQTNAICF